MDNPWTDLPAEAPFVLPQDKPVMDRYAPLLTGDHTLRLDKLPLPYVGSPAQASVLLLALNGGFKPHDIDHQNNDQDYAEQNRKNLTFESRYSFFYLDPAFDYTGGCQWWHRRLRHFIDRYGLEAVASQFACVQSFPYCSTSYKALPRQVPSQEYSFSLVRQAVQDSKPIVIMRSREIWFRCIPELRGYPYIELRNARNPYFSPAQMSASQFERLEAALE